MSELPLQLKGEDGLILIKKNGKVLAGAFDTDNFNHNSLAQSTLVQLGVDDEVWVDVLSGGVRSNDNVYVHFIGMMIG